MNLESPSKGSNEGDDKGHRCLICGYGLSNWIQNSYDFADEVKLIRYERQNSRNITLSTSFPFAFDSTT